MITVRPITDCSPSTAQRIAALLGSLTPCPPSFGVEELSAITADADTVLLGAYADDVIVGMLTLAAYRSPIGVKVWIEDVAAEPAFRGQGIGRRLVEEALRLARERYGQCKVMLTSNPTRQAARALYRSIGFEEYDTGVYRYIITK